ncbi:uncharacterized protein RCO7_02719 [Rhynchosporium graminicola]|uniref:Fibronectin type-III domain-containing protein n=1 Tax=Rhynchosporium graminicola TaxID=2792576 RepID=A0A1E1KG38_9HELO|nr:uncharacterized protein RCO7_02719 [Rhynchosporium commune]
MSLVAQLPWLSHNLLHLLLFSLGSARGTVIKPFQIKAIAPACTTLANGLTTCNVGVNTVPPLKTLDGGYQWLTVEPAVVTLAGSAVTSTEYVSFVTSTTGSAAAPTAAIVAAVIAPAAVGYLQPIVDTAGGKTVAGLGAEILSVLAKEKIFITAYEADQLAAVIIIVGTNVVIAGTVKYVYSSFRLSSYIRNINIKPIPSPTETITSTTSSATPEVTAIIDLPYPDYLDFQAPMIALGPTPTVDDFRPTDVPAGGQQIAIASYINPLGDPVTWQRLLAYDSNKVSVLVANVLNGPDYIVEENWKAVIDQATAQGKTILGYVRTGYLGVSKQNFTTRLGSHNLADWASQIEQDVDKWFELYSTLGGIFFDEGWPECGENNIYADLYAYINDYTKRKHPGAYTVLNPGSPMAQCFENTMDTLLTFESSYENYQSLYVPNDWTPKDPRKIWHIVYRVPQDQVANAAALALSRGAGLLELTDDDNPNPYDTLPNDAYMQAAIGAVVGGKPPINEPAEASGSQVAGVPNDAHVLSSDYTSVTLVWSPVSGALGYAVYRDGKQVLELPASMIRATVGMLDPGSVGLTLEVRTVLSSGDGGASRLIPASTNSLPLDGSITNTSFIKNGNSVTYTADVLVPYAFVRLFIGIKQDAGPHGWPIDIPGVDNTGTSYIQVVNYLVEGNDFYSAMYKYTGSWEMKGKAGNAAWSWAPLGIAPQVQSGYTHTWTVPFEGTDALASNYVVQGQGYAPIENVFRGDKYFWNAGFK